MSNSQIDNFWIMLRNAEFMFVSKIGKEFLCKICNKLIINAHSASCGCTYCFDCIRHHLGGLEKCCPGETVECKELLLNLQKNIQTDYRMNAKVMKLIVNENNTGSR